MLQTAPGAGPIPAGATMPAARYHGPGRGLVIEPVPVPLPGTGEAVVRVAAAGVCHTELQFLEGTLNLGVSPLTLGHEIAGEVVALGPGTTGPAPGTRVVVYYYAPCGACRWCAAGADELCPDAGPQIGFSADGGFAPFARVPAANLIPLPPSIPYDEAATLGCSVATAIHAVGTIAPVAPDETVVVYGAGAVGFAIIQVARLGGSRVLAVGRSAEKLRLAAALGADLTIDATRDDPALAVLEATRGEGADVVFECVAAPETMEQSVAMLARRGRLVFVGYSGAPLVVDPLRLILREASVVGAVGNTREELRLAVQMAAGGTVRAIVSRRLPLDGVDAALDELRRGAIVGRAVLLPNGAEFAALPPAPPIPTVAAASACSAADSSAVAGLPAALAPTVTESTLLPAPGGLVTGRAVPVVEASSRVDAPASRGPNEPIAGADAPTGEGAPATSAGVGMAGAAPAPQEAPAPRVRPPERDELRAALVAFIGRGVDVPRDDDAFARLSLALFAYQFAHNEPYRLYCERRGATPATVRRWQDVPSVPIAAFKETTLACEPIEEAVACYQSSGTTGTKQSCHYHPDLTIYNLCATLNWAAHLLPEGAPMRLLVFNPPREEMPNSSLAHYLSLMVERYGALGSDHLLREGRLDLDAVADTLREVERAGAPVGLLGVSFAFVHLLDACAEAGLHFALPPGSRIMDTGGFKGRSREISRTELHGLLRDTFGVPRDYCVNMYGLTEHSTQFLDATLRNRHRGVAAPRYKTVPPWARTRVLDPDTLTELPPGEIGLLCHHDLGNYNSAQVVLTEDLGYALGEGFELLGRAQGAEARGCSIAIDELLSATRGEG